MIPTQDFKPCARAPETPSRWNHLLASQGSEQAATRSVVGTRNAGNQGEFRLFKTLRDVLAALDQISRSGS